MGGVEAAVKTGEFIAVPGTSRKGSWPKCDDCGKDYYDEEKKREHMCLNGDEEQIRLSAMAKARTVKKRQETSDKRKRARNTHSARRVIDKKRNKRKILVTAKPKVIGVRAKS
jgi:acetyl-CoA carboxylase beta subunit